MPTLPVLEAAHIRPYAELGPHRLEDGILLRKDLHACSMRATNPPPSREYLEWHGRHGVPRLARQCGDELHGPTAAVTIDVEP